MTSAEMLQYINENYDEVVTADGFDDALIGVADLWRKDKDGGASRDTAACYDYRKCIEILMRDGMSEEDADEYMAFNVLDAWVRPYPPVFVHDWRKEREEVLEGDDPEEVEGLREQALEERQKTKRGQE